VDDRDSAEVCGADNGDFATRPRPGRRVRFLRPSDRAAFPARFSCSPAGAL